MVPHEGEPAAGPWRVVSWEDLARVLFDAAGRHADRPAVVGLGGRSSSGKTTLAGRLAAVMPGAVVLHTDDIAWRQAVLDWDQLLRAGVLEPARRGEPVSYRPPKWDEHGRTGAVVVPAGTRALIVEGVGATRQALAPLLDATVWVQADASVLERRNENRIEAGETSPADHRAWMAEENPYLLADRAWERATVIVAGTQELPHDPETEAVVADGHG
jgi:pantothenate kinase